MAEGDEFEFDPDPPRWLRPALWLSIPLAALSCALVVQAIMALPSTRGQAVAGAAAPSPQPPSRVGEGAGTATAEIVQLARLRADAAAEEARVAALIEAAQDLRDPAPEPADGTAATPEPTGGTAPPSPPATPPPPRLVAVFPALAGPPSVPWLAITPVGASIPAPPDAKLPHLHAAVVPPLRAPPSAPSQPPVAAMAVPAPAPVEMPRRAAAPAPVTRPARAAEPARLPSAQPADPRCGPLLARLQLGERPSDADRSMLQSACAPRR
jgi:hypothetical protein